MGKHADIAKEKRLQFMHKHLSLGAHATAGWFAERLGVSTKTIQRDLEDLNDETEDALQWDRGERTYRYTKVAMLQNRFFICGEDEVTAFLLACAVMQGFTSIPLGPEMERIRKTFMSERFNKLAFNQPNPTKFSFVHPRMALVNPNTWRICLSALNHCHKLKIVYKDMQGKPSERTIIPLHLRGAKGSWYLVSHCELQDKQRTFHMSRIVEAEDTGDEFSPANYKFNPDAYFHKKTDIFRASNFLSCEVKVRDWGVKRVKEMTFFDGQRVVDNPDGTATLTFETDDLFTAAAFVIEMAGVAKAIKPKVLVEKVKENIQALAKMHQLT